MRRFPHTRQAAFAAFALVALVTASSPTRADDASVKIENFTFTPAALTVHVGTKVMFKNVDDIPHSVVMSDGSFHSPALDTADTAAITFAKAGVFKYFCGLHPHMQGTVTVVP